MKSSAGLPRHCSTDLLNASLSPKASYKQHRARGWIKCSFFTLGIIRLDKQRLVISGLTAGPPLHYWPAPHNKLNSWLLYSAEGL